MSLRIVCACSEVIEIKGLDVVTAFYCDHCDRHYTVAISEPEYVWGPKGEVA